MVWSDEFARDVAHCISERSGSSSHAEKEGEDRIRDELSRLAIHTKARVSFFPRPTKDFDRAIAKARDISERYPSYAATDVVDQIRDFAGGRVLVSGLANVRRALEFFGGVLKTSARWRGFGSPRDFLDVAKPGGWRGIIQDSSIRLRNGDWFPYEMQFMTFGQDSWDQLEHRFYELMRAGYPVASDIDVVLLELSRTIYALETEFDKVRDMLRP